MPTCAVYARLSQDRDDQTSTSRQEHECRAWADRAGLDVAEVFVDTGRSGYRRGVERPAFEEALEWLRRTGETLVVWKLDRLSRRGMGQVGTILDDLEDKGGRIVSVVDGVDTSQSHGRMVVAILSEMARAESENIGTRIKSMREGKIRSGKWPGALPPFGHRLVVAQRGKDNPRLMYDPSGPVGRLVIHEGEAAFIRSVVEDLFEGESIRHAVRRFNESGFPPYQGKTWGKTSVERVLRSPVLAGRLGGRGGEVLDDDNEPVEVVSGPTVLTLGEYRRLGRLLEGRRRPRGKSTSRGRALLTGLLECSACGGRYAIDRTSGMYRCARRGASCSNSGVGIAAAEEFLSGAALRRLATLDDDPDALAAVAERWHGLKGDAPGASERAEAQAMLDDALARREELASAHFLRGTLSGEMYDRLAPKLDAEIAQAREALTALPDPAANLGALLDLVSVSENQEGGPLAPGSAWDQLPVVAQQDVLAAVISRAVVQPLDASERLLVEFHERTADV